MTDERIHSEVKVKITLDEDEVSALIEALSHLPYRDTYANIQILAQRVDKARKAVKIETGE